MASACRLSPSTASLVSPRTMRTIIAPARVVAGRLRAPPRTTSSRQSCCYSTVSEGPSSSRSTATTTFTPPAPARPTSTSKAAAASASYSAGPSSSDSDGSPRTSIEALQRMFSQPGSILTEPLWAQRLQEASEQLLLSDLDALPRQVVLVRLQDCEKVDLLRLMAEDALSDPEGKVPALFEEGRKQQGGSRELRIGYGDKEGADIQPGSTLRVPLPWLREANVELLELQKPDPSSEDVASRLYSASQAYISLSYSDLFSPNQPGWTPNFLALIRRFSSHPGLHLVVSHDGELRSHDEERQAAAQLNAWIRGNTTSLVEVPITFVSAYKAKAAQEALRGAMGFATAEDPSLSSGTTSDSRSALWTRFQALSAESGIPSLISSISSKSSAPPHEHLQVLIQHAEEEALARLSLARSELEEYGALASWLERSADSETKRAVTQALASASASVEEQPTSTGHEPPLLPKWWKLPVIGDAETRNRVHEALENDWLGGKRAEERLIWWAGRLKELQAAETKDTQAIVDRLHSGQSSASHEDDAQPRPPTRRRTGTRRVLPLPHTRLLEIRAESPAYHRAGQVHVDFDDPTLLAYPLIRARDHFFGRSSSEVRRRCSASSASSAGAGQSSAAGVGPAPAEGGVSLLDVLQRRVQTAVYRFWATVGLSWGAAGWGLASHHLFHSPGAVAAREASASASASQAQIVADPASGPLASAWATLPTFSPSSVLTDILSYPNFDPSTSLGIALLGTTVAFYQLQRAHARLSRRLLTRDVLTRIPANVRADLDAAARDALEGGVFRWRREVGRILKAWVQEEEQVLRRERERWDRRRDVL